MSITIRATGQASRRGARHRTPTAAALLEAVDEWLATAASDTLHEIARSRTPDGAVGVHVHPAARPIRIEATDGGNVTVTALTVPVGPGYHTFVGRLVERLGEDLDIDWRSDADATAGGPWASWSVDRVTAERLHLGWLRAALGAVHEARRKGETGLHLATPPGERFEFDGAVATVLGPRDDAWLERALGDPRVAADVWPWVADAMDARYLQGRALTQLWLDVRWRPPIGPAEIALVDDVLETLRRAYPLEPGLAWPWREWRDVLALRGRPDPVTMSLIERAMPRMGNDAGDEGSSSIGYHRRPVTIVHGGWALELPGSFSSTRTVDEWSGADAGRSVAFAGTPTEMSADQFLRQVASHLGREAIEHDDGVVRGRARLTSDTSSGVEVATIEGYSAIRGRGAAIRVEIDDPQDWKWALDTWRSLRPA